MRSVPCSLITLLTISVSCWLVSAAHAGDSGREFVAERLGPESIGRTVVESMDAVVERERESGMTHMEGRRGTAGEWVVPSVGGTFYPKSGQHNLVNKWGDRRMGIGFPGRTHVLGAYIAGQAAEGVWTPAVRVIGYRDGVEVGRTGWHAEIGKEAVWFEMDLVGVDRIVFEAKAAVNGAGWYAIDDLAFVQGGSGRESSETVVLDFEDCSFKQKLTGSTYAGLTWEKGTGDFGADEGVPAPLEIEEDRVERVAGSAVKSRSDRSAFLPSLVLDFEGVKRGDAGSTSFPPDTHGAVGPNHFVEVVNRVLAVYDKATGSELLSVHLESFVGGYSGDPRVVYDHHSGRWIVISSDFDTTIYLAMSVTDDPTGDWFKASLYVSRDGDIDRLPDYPTLGFDSRGVYIGSLMAGSSGWTHSLFVVEKAPLLNTPPVLDGFAAFRSVSGSGSTLQPAVTYGDPGAEYVIARNSYESLEVFSVEWSGSVPGLTSVGEVATDPMYSPSDAPALGSDTSVSTVGPRLMNAVFRNGSLWTCNTVWWNGPTACRWHQIDAASLSVIQYGTVSDDSLYYYFPSIAVNANNDVVMGFSGSNASQYVGCYYTGRRSADPAGEMAVPVQYRVGAGAQNNLDGYGRNRWGDYSFTSVDPVDDIGFWTIQAYGHDEDVWGTHVAHVTYGDCNNNYVDDALDIAEGTSNDANNNGRPDECEEDCNKNLVLDYLDIVEGDSEDCNSNGIPDECELDGDDCNSDGVPDSCELKFGTSLDCNGSNVPDECELSGNDCNGNLRPDECDWADVSTGDVTADRVEVCRGSSEEFLATASGSGVEYRWYLDDSMLVDVPGKISGSDESALNVADIGDDDVGRYWCEMTLDGCIVKETAGVELAIVVEPGITSVSNDTTLCEGSTVTLVVDFEQYGEFAYDYTWYRDGVAVKRQPNWNRLAFDNVTVADRGTYTCRISYAACGVDAVSPGIELSVLGAEFTQQPVTQCLGSGATAALTAVAVSEDAITGYRWQRWYGAPYNRWVDVALHNGAEIPPLEISPPLSTARYRGGVYVENVCWSYSAEALITVDGATGDLDGDGDVDLIDMAAFGACIGLEVMDHPECTCGDFVGSDGVVDALDWVGFEVEVTGP